MVTKNINLTTHFDQFVKSEIAAGHYSSASEVMRAGLNLLEKQKKQDEMTLQELRLKVKLAREALRAGQGQSFKSIHELQSYLDETRKNPGRS
jgi:antitoxin ParD1/3/4